MSIKLSVKPFALVITASLCGILAACGGSPKPAVEPVAEKPSTPATPDMNDVVNRYSYALGIDFGKAVSNINVPFNMDLLLQAITDQMDSTRPVLLTDSAAETALQELLLKMQAKKEADIKAAAQKALEDQAQFLAKNVLDSNVKVTPKGVQYKVIQEGTGAVPSVNDIVVVHYVGSLLDGTQFDNSIARGEPLEFPVNAVIEGWQDLLQVMKEGMKVNAWIPSALAYGEEGVSSVIPPNSLLVFEVELVKVKPTAPEIAPEANEATATPATTDSSAVKAAPATDAPAAEQTAPAEQKTAPSK